MTVSAIVPVDQNLGNDSATNFNINFPFDEDGDITVVHRTTAGVETTPVLNVDYTLNGAGTDTRSIDFPKGGSLYSTLASGSPAEKLTVYRSDVLSRVIDISGTYHFVVQNADLDRITKLIQQLSVKVENSIQRPVSDSTAVDFILPNEIDRASMLIGCDANGDLALYTLAGVSIASDTVLGVAKFLLADFAVTAGGEVSIKNSGIDHGGVGGLADDDHAGYPWGVGRTGGQTIYGGANTAEELTLADNFVDGNSVTIKKLIAATKGGIKVTIDGSGSVIPTGVQKIYVSAPYSGTITKVRLLADQSGSIVVDVWKDTYANFPPTVADTITAAAKPTLSGAIKSEDSTLTGWTTSVIIGDVFEINVDSAATLTKVTLEIFINKTGA